MRTRKGKRRGHRSPTGSPPATPTYVLTVATAGAGTGKVTGPGLDTSAPDLTETFPLGTQVPLLATPTAGSLFDHWSGSASGSTNPITISMDGTKTVTANFVGTPGGDPVESHLGSVVNEDLVTELNPVIPWGAITDPYSYQGKDANGNPVNPVNDPYITRRSDDPSPYVPHGRGSPSTYVRQLESPLPPTQSIFDAGVIAYPAAGANTRTQCEHWTGVAGTTFVILEEGDRGFLLGDFRVVDPTMLPYTLAERPSGGGSTTTQIVQCKVSVPGAAQDVAWAINAFKDGYRFRTTGGPSPINVIDLIECDLTQWQKIALEILFSSDPGVGYYTLWGKIDGGDATPWAQLSPQRNVAFLFPGGSHANIGIGPYHRLGIMGGVYKGRFANFQWVAYA